MVCVPGDSSYNSTVLLYHCDSANGSTTFVDNSFIAANGTGSSASATTGNFKFGTASANFGSVNGSIISSAAASNFNFGAGKFTIECWARTTVSITGTSIMLAQLGFSPNNFGWRLELLTGNVLRFLYSLDGTNALVVSGSWTPTLNVFQFYAADRDASNVIRVYANGAVIASATVASTLFASTQVCRVGNDGGTASGWVGQIDDARITKGVARYGGAFTPPTAAFPNQLASVGCAGGFFHGPFSEIRFPSPTLVAAMAGVRAIMRNKSTTRRGLLRSVVRE